VFPSLNNTLHAARRAPFPFDSGACFYPSYRVWNIQMEKLNWNELQGTPRRVLIAGCRGLGTDTTPANVLNAFRSMDAPREAKQEALSEFFKGRYMAPRMTDTETRRLSSNFVYTRRALKMGKRRTKAQTEMFNSLREIRAFRSLALMLFPNRIARQITALAMWNRGSGFYAIAANETLKRLSRMTRSEIIAELSR
jgi:hypothetical protein